MNMAAKCFQGMNIETLPVQVVTMKGSYVYRNLSEAKRTFPTLDPDHNGQEFTWASYGEVELHPGFAVDTPRGRYDAKKCVAMRFETWQVERMVSA
jgi:hypothetical protein